MTSPRLRQLFTLLGCASLAPLLSGCLACDAIAFGPSFMLSIVEDANADTELEAGNYELLVIADGVSWSLDCGSTLELDEFGSVPCGPLVLAGEPGTQRLAATLGRDRIQFDADRTDDPHVYGIETLEVSVLRDGMEIASEVYSPEYTERRKGSRACGLTDFSPEQTLSLSGGQG